MRRASWASVAVLAGLVATGALVSGQQAPENQNYVEARRLFEKLEYEAAVKALDQAIAGIEAAGTAAAPPTQLASAYELRARSKFGLGDTEGAQADFVKLLHLDPSYTLAGDISPRVVALFEATVQANVANISLTVNPPTAVLTLDEVPIKAGTLKTLIGEHRVTAEQAGYRRLLQPITVEAGATAEIVLELERVSAVLNILTAPSGVEVTLDGKPAGRTAAGPPAAEYADAVARADGARDVSAALTVIDVTTGDHILEFSRDCFVRVRSTLPIDKLADITVGPVMLQPATATLTVTTGSPDGRVLVDGQPRGNAPFTMPDLCEGEHTVDVRSSVGRFTRRITVRAGEKVPVEAVLAPAFALVPGAGPQASAGDVRAVVAKALEPLQTVTIFAPPAAQTEAAFASLKPPADWLAIDATGHAVRTPTSTALRTETSSKLAQALDAQGVAVLNTLPDNRTFLTLLAAGNSDPDVLEMRLDSAESVKGVIDRLNRTPQLFKPSLGLSVIDVADLAGAVVVGLGGNAGDIKIGDVITAADGKPVANAAALDQLVADRTAGQALGLDITGADGTKRRVEVPVSMTPRLISQFDPAVLSNRVLLDLRARALTAADPIEQSVIRLNTAVALARAGRWSEAQEQLKQVRLPDGPGVSDGTVQYLLGMAAASLGDRAGAEAALKRAQASAALITEDGLPVSELAEALLADLQAGPAR